MTAEVGRHRGHRVGALDGELGDGVKARLLAHQGDVGAVEGGDHLEPLPRPHHLAGQVRRGGVRYRVVYVEDVELLLHRHLVLLRGERQGVGKVLEQRIPAGDGIHLVEIHPLGVTPKPERHGVGDEMHLVPPAGQVEAQLGGQGAASTIGGVAGDADFHRRLS
jgi:hypothetical protein